MSNAKISHGSNRPSHRSKKKRYRLRSPEEIMRSKKKTRTATNSQFIHEDQEEGDIKGHRHVREDKSPITRLCLNRKRMTPYDTNMFYPIDTDL